MDVLRLIGPLLAVSFAFKMGDIGMGFVPMLLVDHNVPPDVASWILGSAKGCVIIGILGGGWIVDRIGPRRTLVASFAMIAVAFSILPFMTTAVGIGAATMAEQLAQGMITGPLRLLVVISVPSDRQQQGIAWARMNNNLAVGTGYLVGSIIGTAGLGWIFGFDAACAVVACLLGAKFLPALLPVVVRPSVAEVPELAAPAQQADTSAQTRSAGPFVVMCMIVLAFCFFYELGLTSSSALAKVAFGSEGVVVYSRVMLINTALCTLLALAAARLIRKPVSALSVGIALVAAALIALSLGHTTQVGFWLFAFLITAGEIVFTSLSTVVLVRLIPSDQHRSLLHSVGQVMNALGKMIGSAAAFPLMVHGSYQITMVVGLLVAVLAFIALNRRGLAAVAL